MTKRFAHKKMFVDVFAPDWWSWSFGVRIVTDWWPHAAGVCLDLGPMHIYIDWSRGEQTPPSL